MRRTVWGLTVLLLVWACTDTSPQPTAPSLSASAASQLGPPNLTGYVLTPAGWFYKSCVYTISAGAQVTRPGLVTREDGSTYRLPRCPHPAYATFGHRGGGISASGEVSNAPTANTLAASVTYFPPSGTTQLETAQIHAASGHRYRHLSVVWHVPAKPTKTYSSSQLYLDFPAFLGGSISLSAPTLQYGYSPAYGANQWAIASWNCNADSLDGNCVHSVANVVQPGDYLRGTIDASSCSNARCRWTIEMYDATNGDQNGFAVNDTDAYNGAFGGDIMTSNNFSNNCGYFPPSVGTIFETNISLSDNYGPVSPSWIKGTESNPSPDCSFDVTATPSTVTLWENAPLVSSLTTNPASPTQYQPFSVTLTGSGFNPDSVVIVYQQEGCSWGSCEGTISNGSLSVKTQTELMTSLTFAVAGTYDFYAKNTPGGPRSSGYYPVTVSPLY